MVHVLGNFFLLEHISYRVRLICGDRVGVGGHATLGGYGLTSRMWGMTVDRVVKLDVVLVDGTIKTISPDADPELFWVRCIQISELSQLL